MGLVSESETLKNPVKYQDKELFPWPGKTLARQGCVYPV